MDAGIERILGNLVHAGSFVVHERRRIRRINHALLKRGIDLGERQGHRRGADPAEDLGSKALWRADLHALEVGECVDRNLGDQRFLAVRATTDNVDVPVRMGVIELLENLFAPALWQNARTCSGVS